ncbi:MAG: glycine cleavage system protein H [Peptostreptococcaceae bacterium]
MSGEVVEINEKLEDEPEYINEDPYDAWIVKIKISDTDELENLLTADAYESSVE